MESKSLSYLHSPPEPKIYYASRSVSLLSLIVFCFLLSATVFLFVIESFFPFAVCAFLVVLFLLLIKEPLDILFKNPPWLEFGPNGIGGYSIKSVVPWRDVNNLIVSQFIDYDGEGSVQTYIDIFPRQDTPASMQLQRTKMPINYFRISLDRIHKGIDAIRIPIDIFAYQVYRDALKTFTYFNDAISPTGAFRMKGEGVVLLRYDSKGITDRAVPSVLPWRAMQDLYLHYGSSGAEVHIVLYDDARHDLAANDNRLVKIRLSERLSDTDVLKASRDFLLAFAHYSPADSTKSVPERLHALLN